MIVWPPPSRSRFTPERHGSITITGGSGRTLRVVEPEPEGVTCEWHGLRDCAKCRLRIVHAARGRRHRTLARGRR